MLLRFLLFRGARLLVALEREREAVARRPHRGDPRLLEEEALERIARAIGFPQISVSHRVSPLMKLVSRGDPYGVARDPDPWGYLDAWRLSGLGGMQLVFRSEDETESAERVGEGLQDTMGFSVVGPDHFLASGHPAPGEGGPGA